MGLLVGQTSVLLFVVVLIRFFIFVDQPLVKSVPPSNAKVTVVPEGSQPLDSILEQIYYDVDTHHAESMDWFTVLLAMTINSLRQQAVVNQNLLNLLNRVLHSDKVPSFVDTIRVTELNLGSDYPLLNNCKVYRTANRNFSDGLEAQFDIDLKDKITLGIETRLLLNYPKPMLAYLPVSASVSLVNFSGRVSVSLLTEADGQTYITFSFSPSFSLEFQVHSMIGGRSKLEDVPKLGQLVESTLRKRFADRCVYPNFEKIKLPMKWSAAKAAETMMEDTSSAMTAAVGSTTGSENIYGPQVQGNLTERLKKIAHDRAI